MRFHFEIELPLLPRRGMVRVATVLIVTLAVLAFPLWTLASHQFSDVPDSNPFHADVSAIADAGVTTGCGGGNYCPTDYVTREQMAAFMNRLGALGPGKTPVVNADKVDGFQGTDLALGTATIPSGMTVTGEGVFDGAIVADNADHQFDVELPGRAPVALNSNNVNFAPDSGTADDEDPTCTGSSSAPTALAGKVCIYIYSVNGIDGALGYAAQVLTDRYFRVLFLANGSAGEDMFMFYTWAYTAP